jgi:hypothetical protein
MYCKSSICARAAGFMIGRERGTLTPMATSPPPESTCLHVSTPQIIKESKPYIEGEGAEGPVSVEGEGIRGKWEGSWEKAGRETVRGDGKETGKEAGKEAGRGAGANWGYQK